MTAGLGRHARNCNRNVWIYIYNIWDQVNRCNVTTEQSFPISVDSKRNRQLLVCWYYCKIFFHSLSLCLSLCTFWHCRFCHMHCSIRCILHILYFIYITIFLRRLLCGALLLIHRNTDSGLSFGVYPSDWQDNGQPSVMFDSNAASAYYHVSRTMGVIHRTNRMEEWQ